jgi:hypothetical protein
MPKQPVSVTLDVDNLLWLRGRVSSRKRRSLSDALDEVITAARTGGAAGEVRSVVGTVTIPSDDPDLDKAKAHVRALFEKSLSRPLVVRERSTKYATGTRSTGRGHRRKKAKG